MTDNKENSPIIRVLLVIIIGTIAFGLLFNLLTGGENMNHTGGMGTMGGYGGSLDTFLGGILILLVKLLLVVLVIAVIIGAGMWIKNTFFKNASTSQLIKSVKNDPILKTVSVITISVIGIIFILALLGSLNGPSFSMGGAMEGHGSMMGGFSPVLSIGSLLNLLIKVLSFILVISLILALVAYIKKQYDQGALNFEKSNAQGTAGVTNTSANNQNGDNTNNA